MTLRNIELLSSCVSFSFTTSTFLHSLNVIKCGKPCKYKFALNWIFTILAFARFILSTENSCGDLYCTSGNGTRQKLLVDGHHMQSHQQMAQRSLLKGHCCSLHSLLLLSLLTDV